MQQTRLFITTGKAEAELLFGYLDTALDEDGYAVGILEVGEDSGIFEVSVYAGPDADEIDIVISKMQAALGETTITADVEREELPDIDWVSKSLEGLKPVRAGRFIVHGSHDRDQLRPNDLAIEIEAGQAFGTGHHGTTSGCLIMIERLVRRQRPQVALDLGTGSAVLAIALAKLSKTPVLATDIDPVATKVASENVSLNGVERYVECVTADGFHHSGFRETGPFDMIIANILPKPLMAMAADIARNLAYGGDVVLSGILVSQRWRVLAAFRTVGLVHRGTIEREGWVTLHLTRGGTGKLVPWSDYQQNKGRPMEPPFTYV